ncbi:mandelate racemase/muconate lactonizing enzyme family protein [Clostridium ljungdahlii]|uniref:D-galactonate dehydratase n=1 Tax=Clostridium ljungdahlii TaxID=1538 RepID=A0A166S579_9CLOT|nr:mandelate racemase/muconate lactonizing enzyme family protein [Clostridium ljungdahlii]OAA91644.1 D-galactonate dehydratase [Clostridium ljungdahlii]
MKITKIDIMLVDVKSNDNPGWSPIVCRIYTDEGIYGDGEAAMAYGVGATGAFGIIQDLSKKIIGMNPLDNEVIWEKLYKSTFWAQNGGPVIFSGISAIDIALWDIKGKYFKMPLYQLLGGKMRNKLRCYASQLQFGWGDTKVAAASIEDYVFYAKKAASEGYDAIKIDFFTFAPDGTRYNSETTTRLQSPKYVNMVINRLKAVREAVGSDVDIIMENHSYIDAQVAVQIGSLAKEYGILFFEEPCTPNPKMNKFVCDKLNIPIAQGERIYTRWGYAPYFENNSIQLIQPDLGNCGGITEGKKICDLAHIYDVGVQMHVCASPLSTAVALHLEAAIPNFTIHEHHVYNLHKYNKQLCIYDYQPKDGYFEVPDLPGIGNEWSDYVFKNSTLVTIK